MTCRHLIGLSAALLMAGAPVAPRAGARVGASPPACEALSEQFRTDLRQERVPGGVLVYVVRGREPCIAVAGVRSIETGEPVTRDTLFRVGSLTKAMTALAVLSSARDGRVDLHAPLARWWPAAPFGDRTLAQLLAQTSGLRDQGSQLGRADGMRLEELVSQLNASDLLIPAGFAFSYSNLGYAVAGATLALAERKPYAEVVRDRVFVPLGMRTATIRLDEAATRHLAVGHRVEGDAATVVRPLPDDPSIAPAGYAFLSGDDLGALLVALLGADLPAPTDALSGLTAEIVTARVPMPSGPFERGSYGYGVIRSEPGGHLRYEHAGQLEGLGAEFIVYPREGVAIAYAINAEGVRLGRLRRELERALWGEPARTRTAARTRRAYVDVESWTGVYRNRLEVRLEVRGRRLWLTGMGPDAELRPIDPAGMFAYRLAPSAPEQQLVLREHEGRHYMQLALWTLPQVTTAAMPR